jgi:phosphomannomutase
MTQIKFGTDGWRALIAREFTFDTVGLTAKAVLDTFKKKTPRPTRMIIGYDRRFLSRGFAEQAAVVYAEGGLEVLFAETFVPTPCLSWCAKHDSNAAGATVITASHNPPEWNGFKFKEPFGGSALPTTTKLFEQEIVTLQAAGYRPPSPDLFQKYVTSGAIRLFNPLAGYFAAVAHQIDTEAIRKGNFRVALDTMYGSASGHYAAFLESLGISVTEIHANDNPGFGGTPPEPIAKNLKELCNFVKRNKLSCGLATDGDSDRLGAVDEHGNYFTTQQILSTVYWHMLKHRKKRWNIARSVSTTKMVDLVAQRAGMKSFETPVGFKFIAEKMVAGEAQIGGEESGGIGVMDHIPERDGPLTGLLLLEVMAMTGKGLRAVYEDLCKEERPYEFTRLDLHVTQEVMDSALRRLKNHAPTEWMGRAVESVVTLDGYKFYLKDGSWILIRSSGTEPIFRLYAEAESQHASDQLVEATRKFVETK